MSYNEAYQLPVLNILQNIWLKKFVNKKENNLQQHKAEGFSRKLTALGQSFIIETSSL